MVLTGNTVQGTGEGGGRGVKDGGGVGKREETTKQL